jgi:FkbM family methyltransferase
MSLLPKKGLLRTRIGDLNADLDFGDPHERMAALGLFQTEVLQSILTHLQPGDCFCDCGAHVGIFSLVAATHLGKGGQVYAFEPSPPTYERLATNIRHTNGFPCRVEAFPVALGASEAVMDMYVSSQHGWSTLDQQATKVQLDRGAQIAQVAKVPVDTLDNFFMGPIKRRFPQVIKIDVEGWEEQVLSGASTLLRAHPPRAIIIEKNDYILAETGKSFGVIDDFMISLGYSTSKSASSLDVVYVRATELRHS